MFYLFAFLGATVLSLILTGIVRVLGLKHNIVSIPRERDVHKKPVPRIGGIAIFVSFIIISIVAYLILGNEAHLGSNFVFGIDRKILAIWIGGLLVASTMLLDDIFGLRAWQKLSCQIFASLILIAGGIGIDYLTNPFGAPIDLNIVYIPLFTIDGIVYHFSLVSDLFTLFWLVGMMNVINFIDGVDGLASGISAIAALSIFLLSLILGQTGIALISLVLVGSIAGFLFWNFPPAKIFMGDSGAMFLGFMLGLLPLMSGGKLATAFLTLGFPIVDGLFVAGSRLLRGKNPLTTPDKTHLHHRFLAAGFTQRQAVLSLYFISAAFAWVALRASTEEKFYAAIILVLFLFCLIGGLAFHAKRIKHET
jgi:UDP-GlcNAc:undecaprenyl-phosphate GlcNAc-1-phosphate transferase